MGLIDERLQDFAENVHAQYVIIIDVSGAVVLAAAESGYSGGGASPALGATIAGAFASAQSMAELMGAASFTSISFTGPVSQLYITKIGANWLLGILFASGAHEGYVRMITAQREQELSQLLADYCRDPENTTVSLAQDESFQSAFASAIHDLFKDPDIQIQSETVRENGAY